jgi:S-formylglutathione hydrolase FrmB
MSNSLGTWSSITVAGHLCDIYEPPQPSEHGFVAIYLHGVHQTRLVDNAVFSAEFARHGLCVIVPLTGRSWWANRISPDFDPKISAEAHVVKNILPYIQERWQATPPRIAIFGTSMGGQGALRIAFKYPTKFPVVAAISPAIDYHLRWDEGDETLAAMYDDKESVRQDTAILHVHPLNWPRNLFFSCDPADERWHPSADRLKMKLNALGIPHQADLQTTGGGHGFSYYNLMAPRALEFIASRLAAESRRVI